MKIIFYRKILRMKKVLAFNPLFSAEMHPISKKLNFFLYF